MPATVERSASGKSEDCARIWLQRSNGAASAIAHVTKRRIRLMPARSSECAGLKRLAALASFWA